MSDYTPTTQQVEDGFAHEPEYEYSNPIGYGAHVQSNRRAFRRWLAEVERAAAEKALVKVACELDEIAIQSDAGFGYNPKIDAEGLRARAEAYRQERKEQ